MKTKFTLLTTLFFSFSACFGQAGGQGSSLVNILLIVAALVAVFVLLLLADNIMRVEAKSQGFDSESGDFGLMPKLGNLFAKKAPAYTAGASTHVLKAGHDIKLEGAPAAHFAEAKVNRYAVQPQNFRGIFPIPKLHVAVGDEVLAGEPLFYDKDRPELKYVAPVSGEVVAINRGAKRSIAEIVILADKDQKHRELPAIDWKAASREELSQYIQANGAWPLLRQRPYDIVANPDETPRDIFVSSFDTAPGAPDSELIIRGNEKAFQTGLSVLSKLTDGSVHLGLNGNGESKPSAAFAEAQDVKLHYFSGAHPAGNVGIQMHHIAPVGRDGVVWTLGVQEVISLGNMFENRAFDGSRIISLTGNLLKDPAHVRTYLGANIGDLLNGQIDGDDKYRAVSGDLLSGDEKTGDQFVNFYDDQVSVVKEGDHYEMFGWLSPFAVKPSISPAIPSSIFTDIEHDVTTNTNGETRAFVVTGQYEKVMPMDIYPQHLMKAIMSNDIERMEGLGILELAEEDVALCEFVCTSKMPLQEILRDGLDYLREQD